MVRVEGCGQELVADTDRSGPPVESPASGADLVAGKSSASPVVNSDWWTALTLRGLDCARVSMSVALSVSEKVFQLERAALLSLSQVEAGSLGRSDRT
jgi:hypothetical protein